MRHPLRIAIGLALAMAFPAGASAQAPATALTGTVSSADEAVMEGVLVSATKANSNITTTVVTGSDGHFSFPADRLTPGKYSLAVRAIGYQLDPPESIEIAGPENRHARSQAPKGGRPRRAIVQR